MSVFWQAILAFLASFLRGWYTKHEHDEKLEGVDHVQDTINGASDDDVSKRLREQYTRPD